MRLAQNGSSASRCLTVVTSLLGCLCLLLTSGTYAAADSGAKGEVTSPDWEIAARTATIIEDVQDKCGSTDEEMAAVKAAIRDYCASTTADSMLESALSKAHDLGCEEECFTEAAMSMRRAVKQGVTGEKAEQMVTKAAMETKRWCDQLGIPLGNKDFATRMKIRFNGYLASH